MTRIDILLDEIKAWNDFFYDHKERFAPQALKVIEARMERAQAFKIILENNRLEGWADIYLYGPIQIYITEIENIYKLQALFPTQENLDKIKISCNALSIMQKKLKNIPVHEHDENSLACTNAFLTQVDLAVEWGDEFFKANEYLKEGRAKLIAKNIELQQLRAQEQAKSLHTNAFFFGNLFYNPAYAV